MHWATAERFVQKLLWLWSRLYRLCVFLYSLFRSVLRIGIYCLSVIFRKPSDFLFESKITVQIQSKSVNNGPCNSITACQVQITSRANNKWTKMNVPPEWLNHVMCCILNTNESNISQKNRNQSDAREMKVTKKKTRVAITEHLPIIFGHLVSARERAFELWLMETVLLLIFYSWLQRLAMLWQMLAKRLRCQRSYYHRRNHIIINISAHRRAIQVAIRMTVSPTTSNTDLSRLEHIFEMLLTYKKEKNYQSITLEHYDNQLYWIIFFFSNIFLCYMQIFFKISSQNIHCNWSHQPEQMLHTHTHSHTKQTRSQHNNNTTLNRNDCSQTTTPSPTKKQKQPIHTNKLQQTTCPIF